jgi:hypothetical protein
MATTTNTTLENLLKDYAAASVAEIAALEAANAADDKVDAQAPAPRVVMWRSRRQDGTVTEHCAYTVDEIRNGHWYDQAQLDSWLSQFEEALTAHEVAKVRYHADAAREIWETACEAQSARFGDIISYRPGDARSAVLWASVILSEIGDGKKCHHKRDVALEALREGIAAVATKARD